MLDPWAHVAADVPREAHEERGADRTLEGVGSAHQRAGDVEDSRAPGGIAEDHDPRGVGGCGREGLFDQRAQRPQGAATIPAIVIVEARSQEHRVGEGRVLAELIGHPADWSAGAFVAVEQHDQPEGGVEVGVGRPEARAADRAARLEVT